MGGTDAWTHCKTTPVKHALQAFTPNTSPCWLCLCPGACQHKTAMARPHHTYTPAGCLPCLLPASTAAPSPHAASRPGAFWRSPRAHGIRSLLQLPLDLHSLGSGRVCALGCGQDGTRDRRRSLMLRHPNLHYKRAAQTTYAWKRTVARSWMAWYLCSL